MLAIKQNLTCKHKAIVHKTQAKIRLHIVRNNNTNQNIYIYAHLLRLKKENL